MHIVFHSLDVDAVRRLGTGRAAAIDVRAVDQPADAAAIVSLVAACRAAAGRGEAAFAPAGITVELASRPGRQVHALLAWSHAEPSKAVGLVALVEAGERGPRRFSIAWLLVHPEARRRGVATALVRDALAEAAARGAAAVAVETHEDWVSASSFWRRLAG